MTEAAVQILERVGADVLAQQNELGETALALALQCGHAEVALLLLEKMRAEGLQACDEGAKALVR